LHAMSLDGLGSGSTSGPWWLVWDSFEPVLLLLSHTAGRGTTPFFGVADSTGHKRWAGLPYKGLSRAPHGVLGVSSLGIGTRAEVQLDHGFTRRSATPRSSVEFAGHRKFMQLCSLTSGIGNMTGTG